VTKKPYPSVVHVVWSGGVGGVERLVHDLAAEQFRAGMDVAVAFAHAEGLFASRTRELGVRVLNLGLNSGVDLHPRKLSSGAEMLAGSDVVHAHCYNLPLADMMRRASRPIVFTHHGRNAGGRRRVQEALKWRTERRFLERRCAAVAANSYWTAELLIKIGLDSARVTVVHNGVSPDMATLPVAVPRTDELVVAFVGRLARFKRVDRIIRAVASLRGREDIRLMIAGGGPFESELRKLVRKLGVERKVGFLGWQSDVTAILQQADVLVLPSEGEPFGLAIIEACAQGLLPIAFADGGGVLECMPPDGRVVRDVAELASVLAKLRGSQELSSDARRARSLWVQREFPIAKSAARYLDLYELAEQA
jgi:glycogen(starch) synthase